MIITFIGNCQTVSICFYFQQLLPQNKNIYWVSYVEDFKKHLNDWSIKCKNKIIDYDKSIQQIKESDIIIYQDIDINKSSFCNTNTLNEIKKNSCKLIKIPSAVFIHSDFDNSMKELITRENIKNVDIKISDIFYKFREKDLMINCWHPKTFLFMEIVKLLCKLLNLDFFTEDQYNNFLKNENYMEY